MTPHAGFDQRSRAWAGFIGYALAFGIIVAAGYLLFRAFASPGGLVELDLIMLAAAAGVASFFSPCAFPLLPGYFSFYHAAHARRPGTALRFGLASAFGIATFNLVLGLAVAVLGAGFGSAVSISGDNPNQWLLGFRALIGVVLIALGGGQLAGWNLKPRLADAIAYWSRPRREDEQKPEIILFLYGLGYNAAGMGCTGPILTGLVVSSLASGGFAAALSAFLIFSLVMAALMLLISLLVSVSREQLITALKKAAPRIRTAGALALIAVGAFNLYTTLRLDAFREALFP